MSTIKEALAALRVVCEFMPHADFLGPPEAELVVILQALEAAQQEAEAWEVIEAWCRAGNCTRTVCLSPRGGADYHFREWTLELCVAARIHQTIHATRLEALTKAAAWCRAELAK